MCKSVNVCIDFLSNCKAYIASFFKLHGSNNDPQLNPVIILQISLMKEIGIDKMNNQYDKISSDPLLLNISLLLRTLLTTTHSSGL